MSAALFLRKQEVKLLLTIMNKNNINEHAKELTLVGTHFLKAKREINTISNLYGIKIAS
jgi:alpha-glucuronidase